MGLTTIDEEKTQYALVEPETYEMVLRELEEKQGQFGPYWSWKWEIDEDGLQGRFVWDISNNNVHPAKANEDGSPRKRATALMGRPLADSEFRTPVEYEDLIGRRARGAIGIKKDKKGVDRNVIDGFYYSKRGQDPAPAPSGGNGKVQHPASYSGKPTPKQALEAAEHERQLSHDDPVDAALPVPTREEMGKLSWRRSEALDTLRERPWWKEDRFEGAGGYRATIHGRPVSKFGNLTPARQKYEVESLEAAVALPIDQEPEWADIPF